MKHFTLPFAAAIALSAFAIITAFAGDAMVKAGDLEITAAWTRATLPGQPAAAGYMTIENKGDKPDRLVSVSSPVTPMTEVHYMAMEDDIMKMAQLNDGIEIPAGGKVELKPGGTHIMFLDLENGFKEGDIIKVTLKFKTAGDVDLALPVQPANSKEAQHTHGG